jgi:hypothetical protein
VTVEWPRCSLVLQEVGVENPLRCCMSIRQWISLCVWLSETGIYCPSLIPRLESFKYERHICFFFSCLCSMVIQYCATPSLIKCLMYYHLPGLSSKTIVYSKILKKTLGPGYGYSRLQIQNVASIIAVIWATVF